MGVFLHSINAHLTFSTCYLGVALNYLAVRRGPRYQDSLKFVCTKHGLFFPDLLPFYTPSSPALFFRTKSTPNRFTSRTHECAATPAGRETPEWPSHEEERGSC